MQDSNSDADGTNPSVEMQDSNSDADGTNPSLSSQKNNDTPTFADTCRASVNNVTIRKRDEYLLPPLLLEHQDRKTLVLDLDETLVHASLDPVPHYDFLLEFPVDGIHDRKILYMLKRPGVHEFLEEAAKLFEVVVFTAASQIYADAALERLDVNGTLITHRLYHSQCTQMLLFVKGAPEEKVNVKDLTGLGRDLNKTIIVDNSPISYILQPENGLAISSYVEYDPNDRELSRVMSYLRIVAMRNDDVMDVLSALL